MVGVRGTRVKDVGVGQELDVADLEDHVEGEAVAGCLEHGQSFLLLCGERGNNARIGEAGQRADVVGVPSKRC